MSSPVPPSDLVTYEDVEQITGEQSAQNSTERNRLVAFCKRAQAEIRSRVIGVDARIAAGSLNSDLVTGVAVDMVIAALEDLDIGFRTVGDVYPENETRYSAGSQARSLIRLTDEQATKLKPPDLTAGGGAYVVGLSGS